MGGGVCRYLQRMENWGLCYFLLQKELTFRISVGIQVNEEIQIALLNINFQQHSIRLDDCNARYFCVLEFFYEGSFLGKPEKKCKSKMNQHFWTGPVWG